MSPLPEYRPGADRLDRLYDLLPVHVRAEDQRAGEPLRALLRVINGQANVVEDDLERLYENWFVETCDPWAIAYVAAVLGYQPLPQPLPAARAELDTPRGRRRLALLTPRREAANMLSHRRRKGTLAVLEELARDVTGWPARAFEYRHLTAQTQHAQHPRPERGRLADVRRVTDAFFGAGRPSATRLVDLRNPLPVLAAGRGRVTDVGMRVWTLHPLRVDKAPACWLNPGEPDPTACHRDDLHVYTFSVLRNPVWLSSRPCLPSEPGRPITDWEIPLPIDRDVAKRHLGDYYGEGKSFVIWEEDGKSPAPIPLKPVPLKSVKVMDLTRPAAVALGRGQVAVDPHAGRFAVTRKPGSPPKYWVTYHHLTMADIGGGDYYRKVHTPPGACVLYVRKVRDGDEDEDRADLPAGPPGCRHNPCPLLQEAVKLWQDNRDQWRKGGRPRPVVIEILDDEAYDLNAVELRPRERLTLRAGQGRRPLVMPADLKRDAQVTSVGHGGTLTFTGRGARLTLDGLLIGEGWLVLAGPFAEVRLRHCTVVPGGRLNAAGHPRPESKNVPALTIRGLRGRLTIEKCIVGAVCLERRPFGNRTAEQAGNPPAVRVTDSILDSAGCCPALGGTPTQVAFARARVERSTVFGRVEVHALELAEDSLFTDRILVARRQQGCVRFCRVAPNSATPPRHRCVSPEQAPATDLHFQSTRYGAPEYALLSPLVGPEIRRGASDQSEMGAYHDLYLPQRKDNLRTRAKAFTPPGVVAHVEFIPPIDLEPSDARRHLP